MHWSYQCINSFLYIIYIQSLVTIDQPVCQVHFAILSVLVYLKMMMFAWDGYAKFAWGANELRPVSKIGHSASIFGQSPIGKKFNSELMVRNCLHRKRVALGTRKTTHFSQSKSVSLGTRASQVSGRFGFSPLTMGRYLWIECLPRGSSRWAAAPFQGPTLSLNYAQIKY